MEHWGKVAPNTQVKGEMITNNTGTYNNYWKTPQFSNSKNLQTFNGHLSQAVNKGVPSSEAQNLTELIARESGLNANSKNPSSTAHGYAQFLNGTVKTYAKKYPNLNYNDPVDQIVLAYKYATERYGSVEKALAFWDKNKWY